MTPEQIESALRELTELNGGMALYVNNDGSDLFVSNQCRGTIEDVAGCILAYRNNVETFIVRLCDTLKINRKDFEALMARIDAECDEPELDGSFRVYEDHS